MSRRRAAAEAEARRLEFAPAWTLGLASVAVVWLILYCGYFYSLGFPNHRPLTRWTLLTIIPDHFLMFLTGSNAEASGISSWGHLPQRMVIWAGALAILLGAWGWGRILLRGVYRPGDPVAATIPSDRNYLAVMLGLAAWSLLTLGLGLFGLGDVFIHAALAAGVLGGTFDVFREQQKRSRERQRAGKTNDRLPVAIFHRESVWLLLALPFLAVMLLGSCSPETDFDVKEYHFGGPKEYFLNGRVGFLEHNVYTSFPFLAEMLIYSSMLLSGDWETGALVGKSVLFWFAPFTAYGILLFGARNRQQAAGVWGALIYLSTPWIARMTLIAYVEGPLTAYLFATFYMACRAWNAPENEPVVDADSGQRRLFETRRSIVVSWGLCGAFAASAMACKYPGLILAVLPAGLAMAALLFVRRDSTDVAFRSVVAFALGAAIAAGPWLLKNMAETGNPVYPLAYNVFGGPYWSPERDAQWKAAHSSTDYSPRAFLYNLGDVLGNNDWHGPLLFAFAPLALLTRGRTRRHLAAGMAYVGWLFLSWWLFTHRIDRFWTPLISVTAALAGFGVAALETGPRLVQFSTRAVLALGWIYSLAIVTSDICGYNAWLIDLDRAMEQTAAITAPEVAAINREMASGRLPGNFRVLCVGEAELFDAKFRYDYNTVFDDLLLERWIGRGDGSTSLRSADEIRREFSERGVTHILVNWLEILRYRRTYGYAEFARPQVFQQLQAEQIIGDAIPLRHPSGAGLLGYIPWDSLSPEDQAAVRAWAPSLERRRGNEHLFAASEFFAVQSTAAALPAPPKAGRTP